MINNKTQIYVRLYCDSAKKEKNPDGFAGSGFLLKDRYIITCYHVVAAELRARTPNLQILFPYLIGQPFKANGFTIHSINEDNDFIIFLLTEPLSHFHNPYEIVNDNCCDLSDTRCEVYFSSFTGEYGLTKAVIADIIHQGIVQANQIDNSFPVSYGHSGAPVWIKQNNVEHIIGIVKRADGVGVFNFIPGNQLIGAVPDYPGIRINKYNLPSLPVDYVRSKEDFKKLFSLLNERSFNTPKLIVLYGPTGAGKTTLAIDLAEQLMNRKAWFSCSLSQSRDDFNKTISGLGFGDLLVIDNLTSDNQLLHEGWLGEKISLSGSRFDIIITSQNEMLEKALNSHSNLSNRKKYKFRLTGLAEDEAMEFFEGFSETVLPIDQKSKLCNAAKTYPMLLRLYKLLLHQQIIESIDDIDADETAETNTSYEGILNKAVDLLYNKNALGSVEKEIITVLSCFSVVGGMELALLMKIVEGGCDAAVINLRKIGFVTTVKNPFAQLDGRQSQLVIIHDVFRNVIPAIASCDHKKYGKRFFDFLHQNQDNGQLVGGLGVISKLEAVILKMRSLWIEHGSSEKTHVFVNKLDQCCKELATLLPNNYDFGLVSDFIAERFSTLVAKECYVVIPIAVTIARLPPNDLLGEMIWHGTKNIYAEEFDNPLARACCVFCAFKHWKGSKNIDKDLILRRSKFHLEEACRMNIQPDEFEVSALLSGIMLMGDIKYVHDFIKSPGCKIKKWYQAMLSLILLINAVEQLQHAPTQENNNELMTFIGFLLNFEMKNVLESDAKDDVIAFLSGQNFNIPFGTRCSQKVSDSNGLSRLVARTAFSDSFDHFVIPLRGEHTII